MTKQSRSWKRSRIEPWRKELQGENSISAYEKIHLCEERGDEAISSLKERLPQPFAKTIIDFPSTLIGKGFRSDGLKTKQSFLP